MECKFLLVDPVVAFRAWYVVIDMHCIMSFGVLVFVEFDMNLSRLLLLLCLRTFSGRYIYLIPWVSLTERSVKLEEFDVVMNVLVISD